MIHGSNDSKETLCKKPLARRWWVLAKPYTEGGMIGGMSVHRIVDQRKEIDCPGCKKELKKP